MKNVAMKIWNFLINICCHIYETCRSVKADRGGLWFTKLSNIKREVNVVA